MFFAQLAVLNACRETLVLQLLLVCQLQRLDLPLLLGQLGQFFIVCLVLLLTLEKMREAGRQVCLFFL